MLSALTISAQRITSFSENEEEFLKQLETYLKKGNKEEGKLTYEEFIEHWVAGYFTDTEKKELISTLNMLLDRKARSYPHFNYYLKSLLAFNNSMQSEESRREWQKAIEYMLDNRKVHITKTASLFNNTIYLLNENTIFKSRATSWKTDSYNFTFNFDGKTISVEFDTLDLSCFAKKDSLIIYQTKGIYYPITKQWKGLNGTVTWEKAGFPTDSVYATIQDYKINMKKSTYSADSVVFVNIAYSNEPMMGQIIDKAMSPTTARRVSYPRFNSYNKRLTIKDIYPNINYEGGFSMHGKKFLGSGTSNEDAYLTFYRKDTLVLTAASKDFVFKKDIIASQNTEIILKLESDSIYHPRLSFKFLIDSRELYMIRSGKGMSKIPFYNTYHKVDMDFEEIIWNVDSTKLVFKMLKGGESHAAVFESENYFSANRYYGIQGLDKHHPYITIAKFTKAFGYREFYAADYAKYLGMPPSQVRQQLMQMSYMGVLDYDVDDQFVKVRERLFYYLRALAGSVDYDVMAFISNPGSGRNANLSLLTKDITIYGVPSILLSDSQQVKVFPDKGKIILKKNRDFEFNGKVEAGLFDFFGKKFEFSYDDFQIDLANIDSLRIFVPVPRKRGGYVLMKVRTVIQDVTGNLLIDMPNNKSGSAHFPQFPVFNSEEYSYVYYDKKSIYSGVYNRKDFYFQINPYSIDSLNSYSTKSIKFDGNLTSAGIFPPFDEVMTVQPDLSLGFISHTPETGYAAYGTKGNYKNEIRLSNMGLRGEGELSYLTTTTICHDFIFFPDSTNAHASSFNVRKQVAAAEYPSVDATNVFVHWEPKNDEMVTYTEQNKMQLYDNEVSLTGKIVIEPQGMSGGGFMEFDKAEMQAELCQFKANTFNTDSADFKIYTSDQIGYALQTENVTANIDFSSRLGKFSLNNDETFIEFPPVQYLCSMDIFEWFIDKEEIDMSISWLDEKDKQWIPNADPYDLTDIEPVGSIFISTHPKQDSLRFVASLANYKIKDKLITAYNVRTIKVADASILPGDGIVYIEKKAIMRSLEDARIVANVDTKHHLLYNAEVNIFSRKSYNATADYDYVDILKEKQQIHFEVVTVSDTLTTYAKGNISDSVSFMLNPGFEFKGKVKLSANHQFIEFNGGTRMNYDCAKLKNYWVDFSADIDPLEVFIPISNKPLDIQGNKLKAGILLTKDSTHIFTSFLNKTIKYSDIEVIPAEGFMFYDHVSNEYMLGSKEKIDNPEVQGNLLTLNKEKCNINGEGNIDLGIYSGQIKINSAGFINHDLQTDTVELNLMMVLDFYFPSSVLEMMSTAMYNSFELEPADLSSDSYIKGLTELLGNEESAEVMKNLSLYGKYKKLPKALEKSLVLTEVNLVWDTQTRSYVSYGQIGIGNVGSKEINRYVDGKIEFVKSRSLNEFTLYLQLDFENWYYFEYKRNNLFVVSSDDVFNDALRNIKPENRRHKIDGEPPLNIVPASERKRTYFLRKYNMEEEIPDDY